MVDRFLRRILTLAIQKSKNIKWERMKFRVLLFLLNFAVDRFYFDVAKQAASSFSERYQQVACKLKVDLIEMMGIEDYKNPAAATRREVNRLISR